MQTTATRKCPIPGFEDVIIEYNLMATEDEMDTFQRSMGEKGAEAIVLSIEGLPEKYESPFAKNVPALFRAWAVKQVSLVLAEYLNDPNS